MTYSLEGKQVQIILSTVDKTGKEEHSRFVITWNKVGMDGWCIKWDKEDTLASNLNNFHIPGSPFIVRIWGFVNFKTCGAFVLFICQPYHSITPR